MFKFLKSLFSDRNEYKPNPAATPAQKYALATAAVLGEINGDQHEWLHGDAPDDVVPDAVRAVLESGWGIAGRDDLLQTLEWLETEGHRKEYERIRELFERKGEFKSDASELIRDEPWAQGFSAEEMMAFRNQATGMLSFWKTHRSLLGWDLCRAIWLCRWGSAVGFMTEEEAWQRIFGYAGQLQQSFGSWQELGENYLAGFNFWSDEDDDSHVRDALKVLSDTTHENSPWKMTSWSTPLT